MKKRFLLFIIFIIFIFSLTTFFLIFNYLDPYEYKLLALFSIVFTFLLAISSFLTIILYFFKKVYYRGRVYIHHILSSFRQGFFLGLFTILLIIFNSFNAPLLLTGILLLIIFIFLELFIQNLENN